MADSEWSERAYQVVIDVAKTMEEFTPDDVWEAGLEKPNKAQALGAVMSRAHRSGIIEKTGRSRPTTQRESHGTDITIWHSLIFVKK
jgi:hypothetical protein